jgi:hypothetical protein
VAGDVVFAKQGDGEAFGAGDCFCLLGGEAWYDCESADVGQMLLKFILGSAFHAMTPLKQKLHPIDWAGRWPLTLQLMTFSENRNSTIVVKDAGY